MSYACLYADTCRKPLSAVAVGLADDRTLSSVRYMGRNFGFTFGILLFGSSRTEPTPTFAFARRVFFYSIQDEW